MRSLVLAVANRRVVRRAVTGGLGRRVALRFVAGESVDDAEVAARSLNEAGVDVSLDFLGENIVDVSQADAAREVYIAAIERIVDAGLRANVSIKLTQLGLDLDTETAISNAVSIAARAAVAGTSLTLDMEDHRYTDRTIDGCVRAAGEFPGSVGVALQAHLRRTPADLERVSAIPVPVRLCKGAYREPHAIALTRRRDVDCAFAQLATRLMASQAYAMIATHDERLIEHAARAAARAGRARDSFEFQMLYGVRRELQRDLVARGFRVRVYVPFGSEWYPYLMRRIAERPANVRFFAEAMLRG